MKIKIKAEQLFRQGNDIRKYLLIDMPDYNRELYDYDSEIDEIIRDCSIYYNATALPEYIEVEVE